MHKLLRIDWDIIAGIVAAVAAIVLHLLHVAESAVLLTIILVLLALLLLRSLRGEHRMDVLTDAASRAEGLLRELQTSLSPPRRYPYRTAPVRQGKRTLYQGRPRRNDLVQCLLLDVFS